MSANEKCPMCGELLSYPSIDLGGGAHYDCPHCGEFGITSFHELVGIDTGLDKNSQIKLKHLLYENHSKKGTPLFLATASGGMVGNKVRISFDELLARYPQSPLEFFDRALENLARLADHPVATVPLDGQSQYSVLFSEDRKALTMLQQLSSLGYIHTDGDFSFQFTPAGWTRIKEIQRPGRDSKQAFVAMSFDPSRVAIFDNGISPAIKEADQSMNVVLMNRVEHNNRIDDAMIAAIRRSRYMVADYTGQRQNVYYEAGFAHGLGLPVIWCMDEAEKEPPHFDTRQYNYIRYSNAEDLRIKLLNRILATNV